MKTYEFSIVGSGLDPNAVDYESRFYDHGCSDATVSFQRGHTILDFAREALSFEDAIATAVDHVRRAGCKVDRIEPDPLVSLAEIAGRVGMSRAVMTQYSKGQRGGNNFPAPTARVTSTSPLWMWADVAKWLFKNHKISRDEAMEAEAVRQANEVLSSDAPQFAGKLRERVRERELAMCEAA